MEQPIIWFQDNKTSQWNQYPFHTIDPNHIEIILNNQTVSIDLQTTELYYVNQKPAETIHNLIDLTYLHEPSVLHYLLSRYQINSIYTFTGNILIAINPFQSLDIYSLSSIDSILQQPNPHIYKIAHSSYQQLLKNHKSQSILISGESGSGKTVSSKYIMKYLTHLSHNQSFHSLESKILASNPILESFGNAKTLRNHNSSRFGKFIKLVYHDSQLKGAIIDTYLLEQTRIISCHPKERNYHIFSLILKYLDPSLKSEFYLHSPEYYRLLNHSYKPRKENYDEFKDYDDLDRSLDLYFKKSEKKIIYRILSIVLLFGNLTVEMKENTPTFKNNQEELNNLVSLLGLTNIVELEQYIFYKFLNTKSGEHITMNLTIDKINETLESITKSIYSHLFQFIVDTINADLTKELQLNLLTDNQDYYQFIGILDIFGFEVFKQNHFEQLCINFTNEVLQKQFNYYVFKKEQELYQNENISWNHIEYPDNNQIVSLFLNKKNGIFRILDDCCQIDVTYQNYYQQILKQHQHKEVFKLTPKLKANYKFTIKHYASNVTYNTKNIIYKNKYPLHSNIFEFFNNINIPLWKTKIWKVKKFNNKIINKTVFHEFNNQLTKLMNVVKKTETHYVRCIKPNDLNVPNKIDLARVSEQLKYSGVLEAIKIARLGYPIRFSYNDFYKLFNPYFQDKLDIYNMINNVNNNDIQKGVTTYFLKKELFNQLESEKNHILLEKCTQIQTYFRMYLLHKQFKNILNSIIKIQSLYRTYKCYQSFKRYLKIKKVITIQKNIRKLIQYNKYCKKRLFVINLQSYVRAFIKCKQYKNLIYLKHGNQLQNKLLKLYNYYKFKKLCYYVVKLQSSYRRLKAKKIRRKLYMKHNDVNQLKLKIQTMNEDHILLSKENVILKQENINFKNENAKLKQTIFNLTQKINKTDKLEYKLQELEINYKEIVNENNKLTQEIKKLETKQQMIRKENKVQKLSQLKLNYKSDKLNYNEMRKCTNHIENNYLVVDKMKRDKLIKHMEEGYKKTMESLNNIVIDKNAKINNLNKMIHDYKYKINSLEEVLIHESVIKNKLKMELNKNKK